MATDLLSQLLAEGDRKEIAKSGEVAAIIIETPTLFTALLDALESGDETVRAHAAHAILQISGRNLDVFEPEKARLLATLEAIGQWEVQEQLLKVLPKLDLSQNDREHLLELATKTLEHKSAIARTCALQALFDLAAMDRALTQEVRSILEQAEKTGAKSMQARARKLLSQIP